MLQEIALALSAAPESIRNDAGVMGRTPSGYRSLRSSKNGFVCIVADEGGTTFEPECFDHDSAQTLLPEAILERQLRYDGRSTDWITAETARRFRSGALRTPGAGDVIYMLSPNNRVLDSRDREVPFPAHVMITAPYKNGSDVGENGRAFLIDAGRADALLIIVTH